MCCYNIGFIEKMEEKVKIGGTINNQRWKRWILIGGDQEPKH